MTIAISLKVDDGVVLAADSASTLITASGNVERIYNNANKISNLYKGFPIGLITWGAGSIGAPSISTLAKDLRRRFMGQGPSTHPNWRIDPGNYSIEGVTVQVREFFFGEHYRAAYGSVPSPPDLGLIVAGYSAGRPLAEEWRIEVQAGQCGDPVRVRPDDTCGLTWAGQPEAINRVILGYGTGLPDALRQLGVPEDQIGPALSHIQTALDVNLVTPPMPIQDAIDLAEFLVYTAVMFSRFSPGAPVVGGPIEVAAITKHEGFKWIKRKHYFDARLNP